MTGAPTPLVPPVRIVGDLSRLQQGGFGPRNVIWWGSFGFMLIEGTGFLLAGGAYLYLRSGARAWPPRGDRAPDLLWGALFTLIIVASEIPNLWVEARARAKDAAAVKFGLVVMSLIGMGLLALRFVELAHLNVRWDHDAYGSVVWLLMFLHLTHILTDLGDTLVQTAWVFTHEIGDEQFSEVHDNAAYWTFVVVTWLPIWALVYWAPRLG